MTRTTVAFFSPNWTRRWLGYEASRLQQIALTVGCLSLLGALGAQTWSTVLAHHAAMSGLAAINAREVDRASRAAAVALAASKPAAVEAEQRAVARQLDAPWLTWLGRLEAADRPEVGLLSLEVDASSGQARLLAEAKELHSLVGYQNALGAVGQLKRIEVNEADGARPVRLQWTTDLSTLGSSEKAGVIR